MISSVQKSKKNDFDYSYFVSKSQDQKNISLSAGIAYHGYMPDLAQLAYNVMTKHKESCLQYGPTMGLANAREAVMAYLAKDSITAPVSNIMITSGGKQALDMISRGLGEPGDAMIVPAPTYLTAIPIFRRNGLELVSVPQDSAGLDVNALEQLLNENRIVPRFRPKFVYVVPEFDNPTGRTFPLDRRKRLLELANRFDLFIIEDDPYRRIRFEQPVIAPIKALDDSDRVINVGTTSTILAPGLRFGWIVAREDLLKRIAPLKAEGCTNSLTQEMVAEALTSGMAENFSAELTSVLKTHRDEMVSAFRRYLPDVVFQVPLGGYFLWATLPADVDSDQLCSKAAELGVEVFSGAMTYACETPPRNGLRLSYSSCGPARINEGIRRLGLAYAQLQ